jgi:hypothetical protein
MARRVHYSRYAPPSVAEFSRRMIGRKGVNALELTEKPGGMIVG